jgi:PIN domain nuclease of toxin-antitoxin system
MKIICDTHILLFWSQAPERLTGKAREVLDAGLQSRSLACSDISFWEIAMLFSAKRLVMPVAPEDYMHDLVIGLELEVFAITPQIAVISQSEIFTHKDPADRLIAATALYHKADLISADKKLRSIPKLRVIW